MKHHERLFKNLRVEFNNTTKQYEVLKADVVLASRERYGEALAYAEAEFMKPE